MVANFEVFLIVYTLCKKIFVTFLISKSNWESG